MSYRTIRRWLPDFVSRRLFGNRRLFQSGIDVHDMDWKNWQEFCARFYNDTQKTGAGNVVNQAGYGILKQVPLTGMQVAEIGPGVLPHITFWQGKPAGFTIFDIREEMLEGSAAILKSNNVPTNSFLVTSSKLPLEAAAFDIVFSFYNLEHLDPMEEYLHELARILKPGGLLVGAIPCEGGLAWGAGRYVTTRRYVAKHSAIDYDKIICWEHPNFADRILEACDRLFEPVRKEFWPLKVPVIDLNLIAKFIYRKRS